MICPHCGIECRDDAIFCHRCGRDCQEKDAAAAESSELAEETGPPSESPQVPQSSSPREKLTGRVRGEPEAEQEIWEGGYSPKAMIPGWVAAALFTIIILVGGIALSAPGTIWAFLVLGIVVVWLLPLVRLLYLRFGLHYRLTNQRFVHEEGILRRVTNRIEVIDIDDVAFEQGVVDRIVGIGTIKLSSSDRTHPELVMKGIDSVRDVATKIDDARRQERERRGLYIEAI